MPLVILKCSSDWELKIKGVSNNVDAQISLGKINKSAGNSQKYYRLL